VVKNDLNRFSFDNEIKDNKDLVNIGASINFNEANDNLKLHNLQPYISELNPTPNLVYQNNIDDQTQD
jgi:hypothetical protein